MKVFHSFNTMDWGRVSIVVASVTATWVGLQELVPERYHHKGTVILAAVSSGITLMMRSGKSLLQQAEEKFGEAEDKVTEHVAEEVKKIDDEQKRP